MTQEWRERDGGMKEQFTEWRPSRKTAELLALVTQVIDDYQAQGYQLTLRQLYYQLVSRGVIPNEQRQYKKLGEIMTNARLAGLVDWDAIVDRGRSPVMAAQWDSPADILDAAASRYRVDRWEGQDCCVEVWCEKDALSSVVEPVCDRYHVRFMANRGYSSATAMYDAAKRLYGIAQTGKEVVVIYLGDHDPSGMDMTRDIRDRLDMLAWGTPLNVERIALNFDQVQGYNPPPNPVKLTDSRSNGYQASHGRESWELDALDPQTLDRLVSETILRYLDTEAYDARIEVEDLHKQAIRRAGRAIMEDNE